LTEDLPDVDYEPHEDEQERTWRRRTTHAEHLL
jgi:hypothetical protein